MKKIALPKSKAKTAYGLLSEIRKLILAEPKRYNQGCWRVREGDFGVEWDAPKGFPSCGTVACIGGWVQTVKPRRGGTLSSSAANTLGLDALQMEELFDEGAAGNPELMQTAAHAKRGAKHIARFQKKYAAQLKAKAV